MRMPNEGENLVGKVCVCSIGRPFIVTGTARFNFDVGVDYWVGLGLGGQGTVCSSTPCIIAESGQEFHDKLQSRFGGKMSHNG